MFAVVPFGPEITIWGQKVPMVVSDLNVGLLYGFRPFVAGRLRGGLGGWASNSKYSLLGASAARPR
jgi:NADH-quinone oxidoreductase subunit H